MSLQKLRWSVTLTFEVEGESHQLALDAAKVAVQDFPRPIASICLYEVRVREVEWLS